MIVKLLTEHHLEFLGLQGGCRVLSESTHIKMPHCWKLHAQAHLYSWCLFQDTQCEIETQTSSITKLISMGKNISAELREGKVISSPKGNVLNGELL